MNFLCLIINCTHRAAHSLLLTNRHGWDTFSREGAEVVELGRHTILRGWRARARAGSSPAFGTTCTPNLTEVGRVVREYGGRFSARDPACAPQSDVRGRLPNRPMV